MKKTQEELIKTLTEDVSKFSNFYVEEKALIETDTVVQVKAVWTVPMDEYTEVNKQYAYEVRRYENG